MIKALHTWKEVPIENKYRLLTTMMDLFNKNSQNDFDFKLSPSSEIRPLLTDLFCDKAVYWRTAWEFVTKYTDCEKIVRLCSPLGG